jgi:hypothetical protein
MFPNRTESFRSAGVSPALGRVGRAIAWLAVLTLIFAWSSQAFADPAPSKAKNAADKEKITVTRTVTVMADVSAASDAKPIAAKKSETHAVTVMADVEVAPDAKPASTKKKDDAGIATINNLTIQVDPDAKKAAGKSRSGLETIDSNGSVGVGHITFVAEVEQFPKTLDQALTGAMERNPDIATAKAKVKLAEAELNAAQMEVTRKIIAKWLERQTQARVYHDLQALAKTPGTVPARDIIEAGASLDRIEADLRYLIGQSPPATLRGDSADAPPPRGAAKPGQMPRGAAAPLQLPRGLAVEKIRQALLAKTEIDFTDTPVSDVMEYLKDRHQIEIQLDKGSLCQDDKKNPMQITLCIKGSLGTAFEAFEDQYPNLKLVVRDYGILVTTPERAREEGYFPLVDFARLGLGSGEKAKPTQPSDEQRPQ